MAHQPSARELRAKLLKPTVRVASVLDIDLQHLHEMGVRGFIFDLDDTLVHALDEVAGEDVLKWIADIRVEFRVYIVSNNPSHGRVELAAKHLDLPFLAQARKPSRRFFRKALAEMEMEPHEVAIVGDQLFTDVLGGNRLGAVTILVDPISALEKKWHRRLMRSVETYMLKRHAYHEPRPRGHHPSSLGPSVPHHGGEDHPPHRPSTGA
jgi:HAD superfamily phosphatase (TIGR01668 family)